jgi:ketopantoate reductase
MNLRIAVVGSGAIASYYGAKFKALDAKRARPKNEISLMNTNDRNVL